MSVYMQKIMSCKDKSMSMKEIMGSLVRPMAISRYGDNADRSKFIIQSRDIPEAVDLYELAPQLCDKEKVEEEGFVVKDMSGISKAEEVYLPQGFKIVEHEGSWVVYSRPWDKEVLDSLFCEPVHYTTDKSGLWWAGNYHVNELVDQAISAHFPEHIFEVKEVIENDLVAHYELKAGEIIKDYMKEKTA